MFLGVPFSTAPAGGDTEGNLNERRWVTTMGFTLAPASGGGRF